MLGTHPIQQDKPVINGRQLCFFAAFLIPVAKLLAVPALLAYYAKGDLLLPALAQYLLQGAVLAVILFIASRTDKSFYDLIADTLGAVTAKIVYILYALYFVFSALLPSNATSIRLSSTPRPPCPPSRPSLSSALSSAPKISKRSDGARTSPCPSSSFPSSG